MTSPLLQLDNVTKRFGRVVIAEQLSLSVGAGDTVGIVVENLLVAAHQGAGLGRRASYAAAAEALDQAGMTDQANLPAGRLGLLQRKRLELARALASRPQLLLLDEVAGGLTDPEVAQLVEIVRAVNAEGIAVIWIEHVVRALTAVVSRLLCLTGGKFIGDGTPAEVLATPAVREVFLGSDVTASLTGGTLDEDLIAEDTP